MVSVQGASVADWAPSWGSASASCSPPCLRSRASAVCSRGALRTSWCSSRTVWRLAMESQLASSSRRATRATSSAALQVSSPRASARRTWGNASSRRARWREPRASARSDRSARARMRKEKRTRARSNAPSRATPPAPGRAAGEEQHPRATTRPAWHPDDARRCAPDAGVRAASSFPKVSVAVPPRPAPEELTLSLIACPVILPAARGSPR